MWRSFYKAMGAQQRPRAAFRGHLDFNEDNEGWRLMSQSEQNRAWFKRQHPIAKLALILMLTAMTIFSAAIMLVLFHFIVGAAAQTATWQITEEKTIACRSREDRERLVQFAAQGNQAAYGQFLMQAVMVTGRCRLLEVGDVVYVEGKAPAGATARLLKVRKKGETVSLWIGDDDLAPSR